MNLLKKDNIGYVKSIKRVSNAVEFEKYWANGMFTPNHKIILNNQIHWKLKMIWIKYFAKPYLWRTKQMLILIILISITLPNENKEIIKETSVDGKDEDVY